MDSNYFTKAHILNTMMMSFNAIVQHRFERLKFHNFTLATVNFCGP